MIFQNLVPTAHTHPTSPLQWQSVNFVLG